MRARRCPDGGRIAAFALLYWLSVNKVYHVECVLRGALPTSGSQCSALSTEIRKALITSGIGSFLCTPHGVIR